MKKILLTGITLISFAALAPASAQQPSSPNKPAPNSAMQQHNGSVNSNARQQTKNATQPSQDEIKQAQQALDQKGFHVNADGILGPQTKQAVKKFQEQQKLQQTGELDQQTMSALGVGQSNEATTGRGGNSQTNTSGPSGAQNNH
jgi:peptidoglycan hydrolase-like protein with peptidoglycan-binding domain